MCRPFRSLWIVRNGKTGPKGPFSFSAQLASALLACFLTTTTGQYNPSALLVALLTTQKALVVIASRQCGRVFRSSLVLVRWSQKATCVRYKFMRMPYPAEYGRLSGLFGSFDPVSGPRGGAIGCSFCSAHRTQVAFCEQHNGSKLCQRTQVAFCDHARTDYPRDGCPGPGREAARSVNRGR